MNSVSLLGNTATDIELSYTPSQKAVCRFTLAVSRPTRDDSADFIRIVAWEKEAENAKKYLHKGSKCAVSGRIQTGSYKDRDGKTVYTTDVVATHIEYLDPKPARPADNYPADNYADAGFGGDPVGVPF